MSVVQDASGGDTVQETDLHPVFACGPHGRHAEQPVDDGQG
ncbi:hypothetical protein [Actinocorallia populi]|nr:hypothetical protein [Actinocorallia populi]